MSNFSLFLSFKTATQCIYCIVIVIVHINSALIRYLMIQCSFSITLCFLGPLELTVLKVNWAIKR